MAEWRDFGEVLKEHIKETKNGIHIDNDAWDEIEDEADDVEHQYKMLEGGPWHKAYDAAWDKATSNREAASVGRRWGRFEKSQEWGMLAKELHELDMSLKKNVKVSDVPEDWKKGQEDLKITVTNSNDIEDEWDDVEETWEDIEHSRPVRNLQGSLERWAHSPEIQHLKRLDEAFVKSPEGQRLVREWDDVFKTLDEVVYHNDDGIQIDNDEMPHLEDEIDDVIHEYEELDGGAWDRAYDKGWEAATHNKEFASVGRRAESFKKSKEGHMLGKEVHDFKMSIKKNVHVTDVPEEWKKDMFLF